MPLHYPENKTKIKIKIKSMKINKKKRNLKKNIRV